MSKKILVRADDLGFSEGINYGIAKTVREGIIRSVGVMPNMPATIHGLNLLKGTDVCYGQHTNICVGKPLCNPKDIPSICNADGTLKASREYRAAFKKGEDFVVVDEVILEIEAQYQRFVELTGQKPHYFEGHAVASANFFKGLEIVAKRHGVDYLPCDFSGAPVTFRHTKLFTSMDSMKPDYQPFESLKRDALKDYGEDGCLMFVCHPGYLDDYILKVSSLTIPRTQEVAMCTSQETKDWLRENDISVITYDDLI